MRDGGSPTTTRGGVCFLAPYLSANREQGAWRWGPIRRSTVVIKGCPSVRRPRRLGWMASNVCMLCERESFGALGRLQLFWAPTVCGCAATCSRSPPIFPPTHRANKEIRVTMQQRVQKSKSGDRENERVTAPPLKKERTEEGPISDIEKKIRDRFWRLRFACVFGGCRFKSPEWTIPSGERGFRTCPCGLRVRLPDEERRRVNAIGRCAPPGEYDATTRGPPALVDLCARVAADAFLYGFFDALEAQSKREATPKVRRLRRSLARVYKWPGRWETKGAYSPVSWMKKEASLFDSERRAEDERCARFVKSASESGFVGRMAALPEEVRDRVLSARPSVWHHPHESWEVVYKEALWARMLERLARPVKMRSPWLTRGFTAFYLSDPSVAFLDGRGMSGSGGTEKEGGGSDARMYAGISAKGFAKAIGMWQDPKLMRSTLRAEGHKTEDRGEMWCEPPSGCQSVTLMTTARRKKRRTILSKRWEAGERAVVGSRCHT